MALKHILKVFPQPSDPHIYTGLFKKRLSERIWSDKPNKCIHGVSYTQYADAMDIITGNTCLFDYIHGLCWYFAKYFQYQNPEWKVISLLRGNWTESIVHTFCIRQECGRTLFADARGMTDDPTEFFSDFRFGKNAYIEEDKDTISRNWFIEDYNKAYEYIFRK